MASPSTFRPLTRKQLSSFLPDQESISTFEQLFDLLSSVQGIDLLQLISIFVQTQVSEAVLEAKSEFRAGNALALDYLDVLPGGRGSTRKGRLRWNTAVGGAELCLTDALGLSVGEARHTYAYNADIVTAAKGALVAATGAAASGLQFKTFLPDGSMDPLNVLGLLAAPVAPGAAGVAVMRGRMTGLDTSGTASGEVWAVGDQLWAHPTLAGLLTRVAPLSTAQDVPVARVLKVDAADGTLFVGALPRPQRGTLVKSSDQTLSATGTAEAVLFDSVATPCGITMTAPPTTTLFAAQSGLWRFDASLQLATSAAGANVWFWWRVNGITDVPNSCARVTLTANPQQTVALRPALVPLNAGDYAELMWASDSLSVSLDAQAATGFSPDVAAVALTVEALG